MDQQVSDIKSDVSDTAEHPSTTTISTVAVQAGKAKIVLAILRSNEWIRVRIQQMEPDLMDVGSSLEEAKQLRREHDELLLKLNSKQKDVTELLARADDLATQNKSYQEVYAAMAKSLGEAWKDLNKQLECRKMLLDQSIAFHESAAMFSTEMEHAKGRFNSSGLARDVESARHLIQQHQQMKKSILEASMHTLQEGQTLLERIREMGMHADVQNRHATTAACYGIEHLLELLQDRRRHLEELWLQRKIQLEQCLQLLLLDQEVNKVSKWYDEIGDGYLKNKDLGDSLPAAQALQEDHLKFELQAREIQETVLRLLRTADQLVHSAHYNAEGVKKRLEVVDEQCENFMFRMDSRRKNLALAIGFFSLAQMALTKLDEIEVQLKSSDLPRNSAALAERHSYLSSALVESTTPALREGRNLLERVSRDDTGVQGVRQMVTHLQERCAMLEEMCKAKYESGKTSQAYNQFINRFKAMESWLQQIGRTTIIQYKDMGTNLSTARDFLELHERLDEDIKGKMGELQKLTESAEELAKSGDQDTSQAREKIIRVREEWTFVETLVEQRIKLALKYVAFHKKAQQLAIQMDALEQYVKIEKLDPAQISEASVQHKEQKWGQMTSVYTDVESKGKSFIEDASQVKDDSELDTRRAVTVVMTILSQFTERQHVITEYYEHWKVHVTTGKEFKSQWHQFVQEARKTIDWVTKAERDTFMPYASGNLGKCAEDVRKIQQKMDDFGPTAKKAQDEIEAHLKTAEMLSLKGDTHGQRDQIVNELLKVHTRFQARITEYQILLNMTISFFKNLNKLDELIAETEMEYANTDLPNEVTKAELLLRDHKSGRGRMQEMINYTAEEGDQIVVRVRQQNSEGIAKDEVQKVLQMTEERRSHWENSWEDHKARLEQNLQVCQFYFDLKQMDNELDELHRQLNARKGNYGSSLSSVKMTSQAFKNFENSVELIEKKIKNFVSTADAMIRDQHYDSRRIRHEVTEVEKKWAAFYASIGGYRSALDESTRFFELMDQCESSINEASQFLLKIGRKATECKSSQDAQQLIQEMDNFKDVFGAVQDERLGTMHRFAVTLWGPVTGPQKMQYIIDRNKDILDSYLKAVEELGILRDNLVKTEQILAEMGSVVQAKAPHIPRFIQPLQNAEITEGQRFTFECKLECEGNPKIEWFKDDMALSSPDYQTSYKDGNCKLTIEETFSEDTAKYTCKASTGLGMAETEAYLRVRGVKKPAVMEPLRNISVQEGKSTQLKCTFSGEPVPQIHWTKNDVTIMPSAVFRITIEAGSTTLEIRQVFPEDTGNYTAIARNLGGESRSTCRLTVEGSYSTGEELMDKTPMKPTLRQPLQNRDVQEGSRARLDCVVIGHPEPEVIWYHNEKPVKESKDFQLLFEGDRCSLIIREVYLEDSGDYRCLARNPHGQTDSKCRLIVEPLSELSDVSTASAPGESVPPKFTQLLKDIESIEGQVVKFECRVIGHPNPEVQWYGGRQLIKNSADFQITSSRELQTLTIPEVFSEDAGNYMVKATNNAGEAKCYASVTVKTGSEKHIMKTRLVESSHSQTVTVVGHQPPEFTKLFNDMRVRPGESCKMDVTITGMPKPKVEWFFNGEPVVSPDYQLSNVGDKYKLYIPEVFDEDCGRFSVTAENDSGKATCSALLVVVDEASTLPKEDSPPDTPQVKMAPQQMFKPETIKPTQVAPVARSPQPPQPTVPAPTYQEKIFKPASPLPRSPVPIMESPIKHVEAPKAAAPKPQVQAPPPPPPPKPASSPALIKPVTVLPSPPKQSKFQQVDLTMELPVPPQFIESLKNVAAEEGTRVTFSGCVDGKPAPSIKWFKEGRELNDSADFEISFVNGRVELTIPEVFEEDAGKFNCSAKNTAGIATSSAELIVKASMVPPKFDQRLHSKEVREGEAVRFTVKVTGKPPPEVTWYREGSQIVSSPDFEIQQEGNIHSLYIPEVFYEDSGKFSVGVENRGGREMCTAELIVEAPSGVEESASPSPPVSRSPSVGASPDRHAIYTPPQTIPMSGSSREASPMGPRRQLAPPKPQFTRPLQNQLAREGERVVLNCTISPYPAPDNVQWFRNQVEIFSSPDYQIIYSNGICTLTIAEAFPEDSGHFSCTVTIQGVPNSTTMVLTVNARTPAPMAMSPRPTEAPLFEIQLINQPLKPYQTAYFECQVRGYPPPEILWTRRGHPLVDKNRYKSTYDQHIGKTTLTILNARNEDEGEYTCTAINNIGEKSTSALLLGADRYQQWLQEQQFSPKPITPIRESPTMTSQVMPPRAEKPTTPSRSPASFYRPMSERALEEASQARLSDLEADRAPEEQGFKVSHFEKRLQEEIDFREGKTPAHYPVQDNQALQDTSPAAPPSVPIFDQQMNNFKLMEGSDATFVCKVRGNPTPNIQWYHNGRLVRPSNRYVMKLTPDGYCSLRIRVAFPEDAGHYTCCATNVSGRDTCSAELYVEGLGQIDDTSYVQPETLQRMMKSPGDQVGPRELGGVSEKHYKPVFRKVPMDQEVPEGQMCRFDCVVSGRPVPEMTWYRDGAQVFNDNLHKIVVNEDGINSLIIFATHKYDDGTYTCIAQNRAGESRFTVTLNVKPREEASMPRFVDRMGNQTVLEGQSAEFHAQAVGVPVPMMSWQKDGRHITPGNKYHIETEGSSSSLFIPILAPEDTAWYQCTAANLAGTATNRARLIVQVETRKPEPERKLVIPARRTTPTPPPAPPSAPSPTFVTRFAPPAMSAAQPRRPSTPEIKQTFRGTDVVSPTMERPVSAPAKPSTPDMMKSRADIMLSPTPPPTPMTQPWAPVTAPQTKPREQEPMEVDAPWMKPQVSQPVRAPPPPKPVQEPVVAEPQRPAQTKPVQAPLFKPQDSPLLKYIQEDEQTPRDVADHAEMPTEPAPTRAPMVKTHVMPDSADMFNREQQRPPKFKFPIKPLLDLTETQKAHFESRLVPVGDPNMEVEWYKDEQMLRAGHRFKPVNDFGFVALDILYTYPEDNGIYMCRATNKFGTDTVQAELKCLGKDSIITTTQLPEGAGHLHVMEESMRRSNIPKVAKEEEVSPNAPVFDLLPEAMQVEEGDTAKFMVKIGGHPRPRLTWWINGAMVVTGQRFKLRYDGMIHIMEIPKVREYDQGTIRVVAKNPLGEAECSTTLTVIPREDWRSRLKQTPKATVEVELEKRKRIESRTLELEHALKKPKTTVVELRAFERSTQEKVLFQKEQDFKEQSTRINLQHAHMMRQDRSEAHDAHVDRARAMLNMEPTQYVEPSMRAPVGVTLERKEPPTFTKPLLNTNVKEAQPCKLDVHFVGNPTPDIHWYREGIEIQPSRDFQITLLPGKSFLYIPEIFPEDAGLYMVRANNPYGMAECKARLVVQEVVELQKETPPEFRVQMHDLSIRVNEPATFDCQVSGYPRPDVYWTKDGKKLTDSHQLKLIVEDDHYTLLIYEVSSDDTGLYECVVVNKMGKATCSARLDVQGQPESKVVQVPLSTHSAPQLVEPMRDQVVNEGESVNLQCKIVATPDPVVQWYYNNQAIKPSKYFQMHSAKGVNTLTIAGAFPEDEGVYKCTARNQAGEVTCIAHLRVNPLSSEAEPERAMEPPKFTKPIAGIDVVEGHQAKFEAVATGQPLPQVTWFREGHQIQPTGDFQVLQDGPKHILFVKEVFPEDSGLFTCRATNQAGVAECSAELFVEDLKRVPRNQAPQIIRAPSPLRDMFAGNIAKLIVQIAAFPPPKISWSVNGQQVSSSQRHKISYEDDMITLIILNTQVSDSGDYVLKASNEMGEVTCKTTLTVRPTEKVVELPVGTQEVTITSTTTREDEPMEVTPAFYQPLRPEMRIKANETARLECQLQAFPPPKVSWYVNGIELHSSPKYVMYLDGSSRVLEVHDAVPQDTGVYTCRALSDLGEALSSTTLYVIAGEDPPRPPEFTTRLQNCTANDGTEVVLTCTVTGNPQPEVHWFHNDKNIDQSEDFVISYNTETGKIDLVIVDCLPDDQGQFKCAATNPSGKSVTHCTLLVQPALKEPEIAPEQTAVVKAPVKQDEEDEIEKIVNTIEERTVTETETKTVKKIVKKMSGQPPRFSKPIQPCVVREDDTCTFSAIVQGAPQPDITWLKDKADLVLNERHTTAFDKDTGVCSLTITHAIPEDIGVYSCRATNLAGKATCTANVVVVPPDAEVTITEKTVSVKKEKVTMIGEHETRVVESSPTFSTTLIPITEVPEGTEVTLDCTATAEPEPKMTWFYNDKEIMSNERVQIIYDKETTTLRIPAAKIEDTGDYTCKAVNELGQSSTKTFLRVKKLEPEGVPTTTGAEPMDTTDTVSEQPCHAEPTQATAHPPTEGLADMPPAPLTEPCAVISTKRALHMQPFVPQFAKPVEPTEEAPYFTLPLHNVTVNDGEKTIMRVFFRGAPKPSVTWYFNNIPIQSSADFEVNIDIMKGETSLVILEVFPEDEGEYMVKAENPLGAAVTRCHMFVRLPSSSEEDVEKIVSKTLQVVRTEEPIHIKETRRFSETIAIDHQQRLQAMRMYPELKPKIEKSEILMKQRSSLQGMKMHVEFPKPEISQTTVTQVKKAEAVGTKRQEVMMNIKQQRRFSETIAIDHNRRPKEVELQFQLPEKRLQKSALTVQQQAAMRGVKMEVEIREQEKKRALMAIQPRQVAAIETQRQEVQMMLEGCPPRFLTHLISRKVMDGDEVRFSCKVTGNPMPDVKWYHNQKVVEDNPDFRTTYNKESGDCELLIVEVFPQDTGTYECVAVNTYGKAVTKATLVVEVYEYVPDSEEATASQTESLISTSSMDELDFQQKTQKFLKQMEDLKKEIHEDIEKDVEEEIVEEVEIDEQGFEETIQMADVKWQIPRKVSTEEVCVPEEKTAEVDDVSMTVTRAEQVDIEVDHAEVVPAKPTMISVQETKKQEETQDLYAEGAEMTSQEEITVEFKQPTVEEKRTTMVQTLEEKHAPEEADDFVDALHETTEEQQIIVDLAQHQMQPKTVSQVQPQVDQVVPEDAENIIPAEQETTLHKEVLIELVQTEGTQQQISLVGITEGQSAPEDVQEFILPTAEETTQGQTTVVELSTSPEEVKQESLVHTVEETVLPEATGVMPAETQETTEHEEITIQLMKPDVEEKKQTMIEVVQITAVSEPIEEITSAVEETTVVQDVTIDLAKPVRKEPHVTLVQSTQEIEVSEDTLETVAVAEETSKEDDVIVPFLQPKVHKPPKQLFDDTDEEPLPNVTAEEPSEETPREPIDENEIIPAPVEKAQLKPHSKEPYTADEQIAPQAIEETEEVSEPIEETTQHEEITVMLAQPEAKPLEESLISISVVERTPEAIEEVAPTAEESTHIEQITIDLSQPDRQDKQESFVQVMEEQQISEVTDDVYSTVQESTQQEEITVILAQPAVEEPRQSLVQVVDEEQVPEVTEDVEPAKEETTMHEEITVMLSQSEVKPLAESLVTISVEERTPEATEEVAPAVEESTHIEQITIDLSQPDQQDKRESYVQVMEEQQLSEVTDDVYTTAQENTQQEEITVILAEPSVQEPQQSLVQVVEEEQIPEAAEEVEPAKEETTEQEEITVIMSQHDVVDKPQNLVSSVEETTGAEDIEKIVPETEETTQQEEITIMLAQPAVQPKEQTMVQHVEEHLAADVIEEITLTEVEQTNEQETLVEMEHSTMKIKPTNLIGQSEEQHSVEIVEEFAEAPSEMTHHEEITVSLAQPDVKSKAESQVETVEETTSEEIIAEIVSTETENTTEGEIHVLYAQHEVDKQTEMLVGVVEEKPQEEGTEDIGAAPQEVIQEKEIVIQLESHDQLNENASTHVEQVEEKQPEESTEIVAEIVSEITAEPDIQQIDLSQHKRQQEPVTRVIPQIEELSFEDTETVSTLQSDVSKEEDTIVDLTRLDIVGVSESYVELELEKFAEELAEGIIGDITTDTTNEEQIEIDLSQSIVQPKTTTHVATQEEQMSEEGFSDAERQPSPEITQQEDIFYDMAESTIEVPQETRVEHTEEVQSESSLEENISELEHDLVDEEEIKVDLDEPSVEKTDVTRVDMITETADVEEGEDIFVEAPELAPKTKDVAGNLAEASIHQRAPARVGTQETHTTIELTEEGQGEFTEDVPQEEEIVIQLDKAAKAPGKPSRVQPLEEITVPTSTEILEDQISEETGEESKVVVSMEVAKTQPGKTSLVAQQEEVLEPEETNPDVMTYEEEEPKPEEMPINVDLAEATQRPATQVQRVEEDVNPELVAEEYTANLKEVYMFPGEVRPEYEPSVVERYRFEAIVHEPHIPKSVQLTTIQAEEVEEVRATQEITEEQEQITEVVSEEMEIIRKAVDKYATEVTKTIVEQAASTVVSATSMMAPVFEIPLSDVTVSDGEKAFLECRLTGYPKPEVVWFVDGQEIKQSADFKITYEDGVCNLEIMDVLPEDEGEYTVKAVNEAGTCVTTAYLTVLPPSRPESEPSTPSDVKEELVMPESQPHVRAPRHEPKLEERQKVEVDVNLHTKKVSTLELVPSAPEAPKFVQKLEPKEIFETMPVTLISRVTGHPQPEITWYQDGQKLISTEHIHLEYQDGKCTLTIDKVTLADEAEYMCEAKNDAGVATTWAELLVEKLISAVEQVMLEEFYDIEIDMFFKWCGQPPIHVPAIADQEIDIED